MSTQKNGVAPFAATPLRVGSKGNMPLESQPLNDPSKLIRDDNQTPKSNKLGPKNDSFKDNFLSSSSNGAKKAPHQSKVKKNFDFMQSNVMGGFEGSERGKGIEKPFEGKQAMQRNLE